jgi:hypothetical protein
VDASRTLEGYSSSEAFAVNQKGQVVGASFPATGNANHATLWVTTHTPPTTVAALTSPSGSSAAGWYREAVTVALAATDEAGPSGIARIVYRIGSGPEVVADGDSVSFIISAEGQTVVSFHAEDRDGNAEASNALTVQIDQTAPTTTIAAPSAGVSFLQRESVTATYTCVDVLSGLASCIGPVPSGSAYPTAELGHFNFVVHARDDADNTASLAQSYSVITAANAIENLLAVIDRLHLKPRLTRSLLARLHSALAALTTAHPGQHRKRAIHKLQATLFELYARRGRGLTDDQANILIAAVNRIIAAL